MIDLHKLIRQLANNAEAIRALMQSFPDDQVLWKPTPEAWSLQEVIQHLYNEERIDFRRHLKELFGDPPQPREWLAVDSSHQGLTSFLAERQTSIAWLSALESVDWDAVVELSFGPNETITLSAGDLLVSWVEHDILHMRQLVELLHARNVQRACPYSVGYAGEW